MFLYARIVMRNLLSQTRLSALQREMDPGTFPRGIEKAYIPTSYMNRLVHELIHLNTGIVGLQCEFSI